MNKHKHPDIMVDQIMRASNPRPNEHYWAISVMLTKGKIPIFAIDGELLPIVKHTVQLIGRNNIRTRGKQFQVLTFAGQKAKWAIDMMKTAPGIDWLEIVNGNEIVSRLTTAICLDKDYVINYPLLKPLNPPPPSCLN